MKRALRAAGVCGLALATLLVAACAPAVPADFVEFAKALQAQHYDVPVTGTAWYPTYLPAGFTPTTINTGELGEGSGPVCDVVFSRGEERVSLSQGSPVMRDYEIVPIGTVPWGSVTADIMDSDGEPGGATFIVYGDQRNLAELSSDEVGMDELKRMAASMRPVP
jgi:hypothetical protein